MARKRYEPEETVSLLRRAGVLYGQGLSMADAIRQFGISEVTFCRLLKDYAGMSSDQLRRLKEFEMENVRLRRVISDLILDRQMLKDAAEQNFYATRAAGCVSIMSAAGSGSQRVALAAWWGVCGHFATFLTPGVRLPAQVEMREFFRVAYHSAQHSRSTYGP